jgi:hypothetical protein
MKPNDGRFEGIAQIPEVGDVIYLPSEHYLSHGVDDLHGGKATVTSVEEQSYGGHAMLFVRTAVKPDTLTSWRYLEEMQAELAERFGDTAAHPDPDDRPEFNDPSESWL